MQKNRNVTNSYLSARCDRCGSKRKIARTWKEDVPTFSGTTEVEFSQIVCVNEVCQIEFDKGLQKEKESRDVLKVKKEANDAVRKANSLSQAKKTRENKSRI